LVADTTHILKSTIDNPFIRFILSKMGYCTHCGKNHLEVALELFSGARTDACVRCHFAAKIISFVLRLGGSAFGIGKEGLKEKFSDPSWRKGLANVITGIAKFGVQKPFVPGSPFLIVWDITKKCNLKCKHCYANAGSCGDDELSTEQAKKVIDTLAKNSVPIISFSGGEPLTRSDFFELAKYASDKGIYVATATNGTLITPEIAKKMKASGVKFVQISVDGASAESHDNFRGMKGVFNKTLKGIQNCVNENFFVNIATTATKDNFHEIPEIVDLCENLGVNWFMIYNFVPVGRGQFISNNDITPEQREQLLHMMWERMKNNNGKVNLLSTAPQFARVALEAEIGQNKKIIPTHFSNPTLQGRLVNLAEFIGGCGCGRFYCAIRSNGDIEPCVFFPLKLGNILEDDLEDLWENNTILKELRNKDILKDQCGDCQYRYYCGGCRARAYGYTGDYLRGDPGCIKNSIKRKKVKNIKQRPLVKTPEIKVVQQITK
jgi:radical SAM protein with 4Fe4S-binding SPASM domain